MSACYEALAYIWYRRKGDDAPQLRRSGVISGKTQHSRRGISTCVLKYLWVGYDHPMPRPFCGLGSPFSFSQGVLFLSVRMLQWTANCRWCRLEVWPGFVTSILQFESSTMLIADVSHKVLHFQTVLDAMYEVYNQCRGGPNFKELVAKKIIGQIVLTRYLFSLFG